LNAEIEEVNEKISLSTQNVKSLEKKLEKAQKNVREAKEQAAKQLSKASEDDLRRAQQLIENLRNDLEHERDNKILSEKSLQQHTRELNELRERIEEETHTKGNITKK